MRGRTNVGGGGLAINATSVNKTVKSGNIIAGDFVEYYTDPTYIDQGQDINFAFTIGDYDIAQLGSARNMLAAFKDGEQKFTYSGYDCRTIAKFGNFILFYDITLGILGVLSITSNGFNLVSTISTGSTYGTSYITAIAGGGGKVCFYLYYNKILIGVADISNAGILSNFVLTTTTKSDSSSYYKKALYYYNGIFYGIQIDSHRIYPITIDANNSATIGTEIAYGNIDETRAIYQNNDIVIFAGYRRKGSSSSYEDYYQIYGRISIVNFTTGNTISKNLPNNGEVLSYIKNGKFLMVGKASIKNIAWGANRSFHYYIPNSLYLCSINEQTYEINVLSGFTLPDDYTNPSTSEVGEWHYNLFAESVERNLAVCDPNLVYAQCKTVQTLIITTSGSYYSSSAYLTPDSNLYLYDIEDNVLQETVDKDYVIPYTNGGHPIGVAKDPGTTGSIIGVYIPVPVE